MHGITRPAMKKKRQFNQLAKRFKRNQSTHSFVDNTNKLKKSKISDKILQERMGTN